jgi:hypothetical protein
MSVKKIKESLGSSLYQTLRKDKNLNLKEISFVALYVTNGFNATDAYMGSIARKGTKRDTANSAAVAVIAKSSIKDAIRVVIDSWLAEKKGKLEAQIIGLWYHRAFYDTKMFVDGEGAVAFKKLEDIPEEWRCVIDGIEAKYYGKDADRKVVVLKLANKEAAARELGKYIQLYADVAMSMGLTSETVAVLHQVFRADDKGKKPDEK